jgi:hypothetical protein
MRIKHEDWFGIRFCQVTPHSKSLRAVCREYLLERPQLRQVADVGMNKLVIEAHFNDEQRHHYLFSEEALQEMTLLPVRDGFDFGLLDTLPQEKGCLLLSPTRFIRYHVNKVGLFVLDASAPTGAPRARIVSWSVRWAEGNKATRDNGLWPFMETAIQALAFLHLAEPEFISYEAQPVSAGLAARLLNPRLNQNPNQTHVRITRVGKGWNQFLVDSTSGKVRGHTRIARVGKGWLQRRLVAVSPHERTRKIVRVAPASPA